MASPTINAALVAPARTGSTEQAQSSALVKASSAARTNSGLGLVVLLAAIAQPSRLPGHSESECRGDSCASRRPVPARNQRLRDLELVPG